MFDFKTLCSTEPKFNEQWGLNTNIVGEYDINICKAWTKTKGSSSVLVAVYDTGIDTAGTEFVGRLHSKSFCSQYLFNYGYYNSGWTDHGSNVASVIAANDNNNLTVGVAPNVKLMNVTHSFGFIENGTVHHAKGISWAWRNGAHIINNSWGDNGGANYEDLYSEILEDAIDSALVHGRGGLGTIIVFSSGNANKNFVEYPGNYSPNILVVGASNRLGQRTLFPVAGKGSSYGIGIDVVAPGLNIPMVSKNNAYVVTNGTSFAAPHVSGVAALILSHRPQLTGQQVRDIIEQTCQKVGGYSYIDTTSRPNGTWDNEVGYGLIDAHAALIKAEDITCTNTTALVNQTVTNNLLYQDCIIEVISSTINSGGNLILRHKNYTELKNDFEVKLGGSLEINTQP